MLPCFRISFFVFFVALTLSCNSEYEEITFKDFSDIKIKGIAEGKLLITGNLQFFNPNDKKVRLSSAEIDVWSNENKVATIVPDGSIKIMKKSEFQIPVEASLDMNEMDWVGSLFSVLGGKREKVRFKGYIVLRSWLIPFKVPIDFEQEIKL